MVKPVKATRKSVPNPGKYKGMAAIGFDLSLYSLTGCIKVDDRILGRVPDPSWISHRWEKGFPHNEKLKQLSKAHEFVLDLLYLSGAMIEHEHIYIGIEQFPISKFSKGNRVREQCELIGSFMGGLLRYGYPNVTFVNPKSWQSLVAADLDKKLNELDKWDVKEWAIEVYDAPAWRDLTYHAKRGLIPRPKGSKAQSVQPDDRFDSTGVMEYVWDFARKQQKKLNYTKN